MLHCRNKNWLNCRNSPCAKGFASSRHFSSLVVLAFANDWSNGQATGGNAADAGLRAGDPDLCLTELVDTAPQSADGTGKKNPEPDQETLCGDGFAVNRQRILTIAATRVVVRKVAAVRLAHGERAII